MRPPSPVVLFGAGPYARLLRKVVEDTGRPVSACVVDSACREADALDGLPIHDWESFSRDGGLDGAELVVAIGYRSMRVRADTATRIERAGGRLATIVHPDAQVADSARIGAGCVIFAGAAVEHFATIGRNNTLWTGAIFCHDSVAGDDNYLAPGVTVSGNCRIASRCFFGTRAALIDGISVGDDCLIGAGALLTRDATARGCYIGSPARRHGEIAAGDGVRVGRTGDRLTERPL